MNPIEKENPKESRAAFATDASRWQAVQARDATADGVFVYAVKTTGIYCRPSCPARQAKRVNVVFHAAVDEAEAAGFRACKRCAPRGAPGDDRRAVAVAEACRLIDAAEEAPDLRELAEAVGMSRYHFHRVFKSLTGLTPKGYAAAARAGRMRESLSKASSVTEAIYAAGFNSSGRFYDQSRAMLGMAPKSFMNGGQGEQIRFAVAECSLGPILIAASGKGLCAVSMADDPAGLVEELQQQFLEAELVGADREFEEWVSKVVAHVEDPRIGLDLPFDLRGTVFQRRVWEALRNIPIGERVSYAELAGRLEMPRGARAVARACAANTLAVVVPCHRVVRSDGELSGYRWGVERKGKLLERESQA